MSRSLVSDIATGRARKDIPWPEGQQPAPKRAGGQHEPIEDYDPTNRRIQELEAEIIHLTEERNRERQRARSNAKTEGLFKAMASELTDHIIPIKPLPPVRRSFVSKKRIEEHAVLHLSDGHHDQVVTSEESGGLECYDFPISCCRGERLVDTTLQWTQQILGDRYCFPVLNVLAYGDFTIHGV